MSRPKTKERVAATTPQLFETYKTLKYFMSSLDELTDLDVDHRVLNLFRVTINKEYQSFQNISELEFHKFYFNSFKASETNDQVYKVLTNICACESDKA